MAMLRDYHNPTVRPQILKKVQEYLTRAEEISAILHPAKAAQRELAAARPIETESPDDLVFPSPPSFDEPTALPVRKR